MKKNFMAFRVVVILSALLLGACSGKAQNTTDSADFKLGGGKALASPTIITGQLESINGNEWVVDGQTFIVDSALLDPENPVQVGDSVSLEVEVNPDGTFVVTSVEDDITQGEDDDIGDDNDNSSGETEVENDNEQGNENDNESIEDNDNEDENEDEFDDDSQDSDSSDDDEDGGSSEDDD